ncbi:cuticle protein 7-like isoform X2 [Rhodnius prolixus]|uniref:cuticle protein 7-like isoform X2 n=1 Tax=Rhodnius prolixus TaxID=13249 RepID=UPI003D18E28F
MQYPVHISRISQLPFTTMVMLSIGALATFVLSTSDVLVSGSGVGAVGGGFGGGIGGGHEHHIDYYAVPHYNYEYKVHDPHTGDMKSQHETREGDVVKGYYTLHESDGTIREVHYTADKHNGFNAEVKRIGHAHHAPVYGYHHHHHHGHHY